MIELHRLISDMNKGEKRFFSLINSHYNGRGSSVLLQLFDAIASTPEWDEDAFRKKYKGKPFMVHFAVEKQKLKQHVLDSQLVYHSHGPVSFRIRTLLSHAEILFDSKQIQPAEKILRKALQLAEEACLFEQKLEVLRLLSDIASTSGISRMNEIYDERELLFRKLNETDTYTRLVIRLLSMATHLRSIHADKEVERQLEELLNHPILQESYVPLSLAGKAGFHGFWAQYYYIRSDSVRRRYHSDQVFDALVSNPLYAEAHLSHLISAAINTLHDAYSESDSSRLIFIQEQLSARLKTLSKAGAENTVSIQSLMLLGFFYERMLAGDFESITAEEKKANKLIEQLVLVQSPRSFVIGFVLSLAFFAQGNYRKTVRILSTIDTVKQSIRPEEREFIQRYLLLITHYMLNHTDIVEQQITSIRRHIRRFAEPIRAEELLLLYFQQSLTASPQERKKMIRQLEDDWSRLTEHYEQVFLESIYFVRMGLNVELDGRSFIDQWKDRLKNKPRPSF